MTLKNTNPLYVLVVGCHTGANLVGQNHSDFIAYNESKKRELEGSLLTKLGDKLTGINVYDLEDVGFVPGDLRNNPIAWLDGAVSTSKAYFIWEQNERPYDIRQNLFPHIDLLVAVERQDYCNITKCRGEILTPNFTQGVISFAKDKGIKSAIVSDCGIGTIEAAIQRYIYFLE